ncbi:type IV pilus assembly PilZ [Denitrovibrio acetiphilus DSM 12809]|uniref:Type IV pilus assembly PilZ n=1 Tax=Denitrovibrio acetiphilus (strain DSM 12809 / NBRC 114555 / N2460) TaxID=522772 RepID=D4H3Z3_DENA2|nr:flagellar brake protein [Denitrovibrio acetiphilus]ADD67304.1 type IV pilus assembly PilZ [Denitrovibrio acetiphilus DSM 12809]
MFGLEILNKLSDFKSNDSDFSEILFCEGGTGMKEKGKKLSEYIGVNTRVKITTDKEGYDGVYDSRIEDVTKKHIMISHPSADGVPIPMLPGTKVKIEFAGSEGRFEFETEVTGRHTEGSLSFIEISIPKTITRNQLREFFRVPTNISAKVMIFYSKVPDRNMKIPHKKIDCKIVDLSGGGGKLITDVYMEKEQMFALDLSSEIEGAYAVRCTCIRSKRIQEKSEVSFKFNIEKESERNQIIQYVFKRQIELKQLMG